MVEVLKTIQKVEKLNTVIVNRSDDIIGGCSHHYCIIEHGDENSAELLGKIDFQCGPRNDPNSKKGVIDTDLLEIVRDRLKGFQSTEDNQKALEHIEIALMYLNKRVMDRYERNVLGTFQK